MDFCMLFIYVYIILLKYLYKYIVLYKIYIYKIHHK